MLLKPVASLMHRAIRLLSAFYAVVEISGSGHESFMDIDAISHSSGGTPYCQTCMVVSDHPLLQLWRL